MGRPNLNPLDTKFMTAQEGGAATGTGEEMIFILSVLMIIITTHNHSLLPLGQEAR